MNNGKHWFPLQKKIIANFHVSELFVPKHKKMRLSRGVAVRSLVEICIDDISAVLREEF
jgi:hypothetical protein